MCTSSYHEENTCKVSKRSVQNCKRSCAHKTPRVNVDGWTNRRTETCTPKSPMLKQVRQKKEYLFDIFSGHFGAFQSINVRAKEDFFTQNLKRLFSIINKSFSYQDTPPLRSFLVCILNFDKTSKIFSECNHLFGRHLGETHFVHKSRAITQLKNKEKQNVIG